MILGSCIIGYMIPITVPAQSAVLSGTTYGPQNAPLTGTALSYYPLTYQAGLTPMKTKVSSLVYGINSNQTTGIIVTDAPPVGNVSIQFLGNQETATFTGSLGNGGPYTLTGVTRGANATSYPAGTTVIMLSLA